MPPKKKKTTKTVETIKHTEAHRKNIPTAEYQSIMRDDEKDPIRVAYERRTGIWIRSWSGGEKMNRTGPTWWSRRRLCTSRKRSTPRF